MTTFVCISDTHNRLKHIDVPPGDVLLIAGDVTGHGSIDELERFAESCARLPHRHKIFVAGNHDFCLQKYRNLSEGVLMRANILYLQDSFAVVEGKVIYGSPWQPRFFDWAFNLDRGEDLAKVWRKVPTGVDVLVTHTPPAGTLDDAPTSARVGCADLAAELARIRPKLHVFGHIHQCHGKVEKNGTIYVNAAICDESYRPVQPPIVVELP